MDSLVTYVLRLSCGALICALIQSISGKQGSYAGMRKLLCAIYLSFLAISPLRDLDPEKLLLPDPDWVARGAALAEDGAEQAEIVFTEIISDRYAAYIQTRAEAMSLSLDTVLEVDPESGLLTGVELIGSATPYEKKVLENCIAQELGLERSGIRWIS